MGAYHKDALPPGHQLAEYLIESILGYGGFGITYLAQDTGLGALVAIKEYLPHEMTTRDDKYSVIPNPSREAIRDYHWGLKNFVKEARALAQFKHPNIVRVLRFFEANGTAYMVMEYEKGAGLADHLKRHGPRLDESMLLRVFIPILNGLRAVHEAGMLHLDIKPENIYLRGDGSPMLIDFGSARQAISMASHGQRVVLTQGYAPIEQYPDKGAPGAWTDLYALGASMYRCISGKRPVDSLERYKAVLGYQVDPVPPAVKVGDKHYQRGLLECVDWALQIYPKDRPQSARELQDSLMGQRRATGSTGSRPVPSAGAAGAAMPLPTPARSAPQEPDVASPARSRVTIILLLVLLLVFAAYSLWEELTEHSAPSEPPVRSAPPPRSDGASPVKVAPEPPAPRPVAERFASPGLAATLNGHRDWVQAVAVSLDGKWLASGGVDKTVKLWDAAKGKALATLRGHDSAVNAVAFSPDGKRLASVGNDGAVRLWEVESGAARGALRGYGGALYAVVFSPDGRLIAAAGRDRAVFFWDTERGTRLRTLEGHRGDVHALAFSPDGRHIASAGADKVIKIWVRQTGEEATNLVGHSGTVLALAYSPDGKRLASGDVADTVRIWDAQTFVVRHTQRGMRHAVLALAFSPDGRWLAAGIADPDVLLLNGDDAEVAHVMSGHRDYVQAVAYAPNGALATASRDTSVKLWR
ncbi:MAG: hypothetical protein A2151_04915 [Candidatus Muproteobacteria bacterium RBG_16_65_34]|uniref:Protein kinase domain-containing protein n=1 Tax=Candidatus Muproteobacteria bacterium RBG_16_65_34 TaxID=1817760 RepID=A0A1F6TKE2_9PROT|nr:MAG: hypothetical protein A2151_04915 [Candidatus Muproteobacteria bacterium RBG_16_65_34]